MSRAVPRTAWTVLSDMLTGCTVKLDWRFGSSGRNLRISSNTHSSMIPQKRPRSAEPSRTLLLDPASCPKPRLPLRPWPHQAQVRVAPTGFISGTSVSIPRPATSLPRRRAGMLIAQTLLGTGPSS